MPGCPARPTGGLTASRIPAYTRADFTDDLHQAFGFRTDYQLVTNRQMKKIVRSTKK
jgi:hypothetical protein